jgi:hypothetical protein
LAYEKSKSIIRKSAKKKTTRTAVTTVDWKLFKKSQPNINAAFLENEGRPTCLEDSNQLAKSIAGRNTAGKRIGTAIIIDRQMNAHSLVQDKIMNHVKRGSYPNTKMAQTTNETRNLQPLLSSHSAVGTNFDAPTRVIELCDFVQSSGKIFFNGFGVPSERKL